MLFLPTSPRKTARKPAARNPRWSSNGALLLFDGAIKLLSYHEDSKGHMDPGAVVRALNRANVVLPGKVRR